MAVGRGGLPACINLDGYSASSRTKLVHIRAGCKMPAAGETRCPPQAKTRFRSL